jgi:hypothetical protein
MPPRSASSKSSSTVRATSPTVEASESPPKIYWMLKQSKYYTFTKPPEMLGDGESSDIFEYKMEGEVRKAFLRGVRVADACYQDDGFGDRSNEKYCQDESRF